MVNYCCVNGCNRNSRLNNHLNYYSFPKEKKRQEKWLRLVGREDLIDKGELKSGYRVCSRHFAPTCFKPQSINLQANALPTLCLLENGDDEKDSGPVRHNGIICNSCHKPIRGFRYKCVTCEDYDLCPKCESVETHAHHYMLRIPKPLKFMIADQLIKKWTAFFKAEHVQPDCRDSDSSVIDESDDDEPITKYARSSDSGIELSDDVKSTIREEVARVMAVKSKVKRKKRQAGSRRSSELGSSSKRLKTSDEHTDMQLNPPALAVAFADVNAACDVKTEVNATAENSTVTGFEQPLMHMRLSDDLSQLVIEISEEPKIYPNP